MNNKIYEKLYELSALIYDKEKDKVTWYRLSYSHDREKLMRSIIPSGNSWSIGTNDLTNAKKTVAYTEEDVYPQYFIKEVNYII